MKFRPCIDLHEGKVKQIVGGTLNDSGATENYVSTRGAAFYAALYREKGLTGGHIIMLGPGNREQALTALREYPGGMQVGGGINPENAAEFLEAGASHVIVTSWVFRDGRISRDNLEAMVRSVGRENLVLDLSCRKRDDEYWIVTDRWQKFTDTKLDAETLADLGGSCDEFLVHAADVEGRQQGIEAPVVDLLSGFSPVPSAYAGGIRNLEDIELISSLGRNGIDFTVGSALDIFGGALSFDEVSARYGKD